MVNSWKVPAVYDCLLSCQKNPFATGSRDASILARQASMEPKRSRKARACLADNLGKS